MIRLTSIKDQGLLDNERAVFRVLESGDIGSQIIMCVRSIDKGLKRQLQSIVYDTYWFIDKEVEKGDFVVLYTKSSPQGFYKSKVNETNAIKTHFFYWRRDKCVWDKENVALISGKLSDWTVSHVDSKELDVEP